MIVYHGSSNQDIIPTFGLGEEKHDYGKLMMLGGLGIQYCIKTEKAYDKLIERKEEMIAVNYQEFNQKYNERDIGARENMRQLINSDKNKVTKVFSTLI